MNDPEDRTGEAKLEGTPKGDLPTGEGIPRVTIEGDTGVPWVTLRDAEHASGVAVSTLRKWRKRGALESRMEPGPTGERIVVPLEAVHRIAAERGVGTGPAPTPAVEAPEPPATPLSPPPESEPPKWAMELLSKADARTESLLDRLRQAEEERADAQRDARVAEHKLETATAAAEELKAERDRLRRQLDGTPEPPEPEPEPERIEEEPEPEPEPPAGWWKRLRERRQ